MGHLDESPEFTNKSKDKPDPKENLWYDLFNHQILVVLPHEINIYLFYVNFVGRQYWERFKPKAVQNSRQTNPYWF